MIYMKYSCLGLKKLFHNMKLYNTISNNLCSLWVLFYWELNE